MENTKCIRCGRVRIEKKSWTESVNNSKVTYTETVCPDKECQKIVEEMLKQKKDKIALIKIASDKRKKNAFKNRKLKKTSKFL
jgi:hypothetical protein